jgi:ubiquinol-cytochrome c reductase cytochrome b subunit
MVEGEMVSAIVAKFDELDEETAKAALRDQLRQAARALSAEARLSSQAEADLRDAPIIAAGRELLTGDLACTDCHRFLDQGELGSAPDLTGYGSREWLVGMISNPVHARFYPDERNDRMPAFTSDPDHPHMNLLQPRELELLVDWLRGDWPEPASFTESAVPAKSVQVAHRR